MSASELSTLDMKARAMDFVNKHAFRRELFIYYIFVAVLLLFAVVLHDTAFFSSTNFMNIIRHVSLKALQEHKGKIDKALIERGIRREMIKEGRVI